MQTETLPFLVVHGEWFWIVFVVALSVIFVGAAIAARRAYVVFSARLLASEKRRVATERLEQGAIVLSAAWHGDTIRVSQQSVTLVDARIIVGRQGGRLLDGDRVIAAGYLHRETKDGDDEYDPTRRWLLDDARLYLSDLSLVRPRRIGWIGRVATVALATLASYASLRALGNHYAEARADAQDNGRPFVLDNTSRLALAAALPGSRDKALEGLEFVLELDRYRDRFTVERRRALARLKRGRCGDLWILLPSGRLDEELEAAKVCGTQRDVMELQMLRGDYAAARSVWPRGLTWPYREMALAVATGQWADAAAIAERFALEQDKDVTQASTDDMRSVARRFARRSHCFAHYFRSLAGDAAAVERLRELADLKEPEALSCADIGALVLPPVERAAYLQKAQETAQMGTPVYSAANVQMLLWLSGTEQPYLDLGDVLIGIASGRDMGVPSETWLFAFGIEQWRGNARNYVMALGGRVFIEVQRGDFIAARKAANEASAVATAAHDARAERDAHDLMVALSIREGATSLATEPRTSGVRWLDSFRIRSGAPPEHVGVYPEKCKERFTTAVTDAQHVDGRPLAAVMQACDAYWSEVSTLVGVLPLVKNGRSELATVLEWWHDKGWDYDNKVPLVSTEYAASRRDLSRFVGDKETASRWGAIARRSVDQIDDRQRLTALVLLRR
jgi:hypothetical protein